MKPWPPFIEKLLGMHEVFRKLGFPAEDLFVQHFTVSGEVQFVCRKTINGKVEEFTSHIALGISAEQMRTWLDAAEWWNNKAVPHSERQPIYDALWTKYGFEAVPLVTKLTLRGFLPSSTLAPPLDLMAHLH